MIYHLTHSNDYLRYLILRFSNDQDNNLNSFEIKIKTKLVELMKV